MSVSTVYDDVRASVYEPEPAEEEVEIEYVEEEEEEEVKEDDQVVNADEPQPKQVGNAAALTEDPYGELAEDPYGGGPEFSETAEASIAEEISAGAGVKRKRATQTDDETLDKLRKQIEWYFCDQNLRYDAFFHEKISEDPEGWLDASMILGCARIKNLGVTEDADIEASLLESSELEMQRVAFETEDGETSSESLQIRRAEGQALPALQKREKGEKGKGKDKGKDKGGKGAEGKGAKGEGKRPSHWIPDEIFYAMKAAQKGEKGGGNKGGGWGKGGGWKGKPEEQGKSKPEDQAKNKPEEQGKAVASFSNGALNRESAAPPAPAAARQPAPAAPRQPAPAAPVARQSAAAAGVAPASAAPAAATAAAAESEEDKDSRIKQLEGEVRFLRTELAKARGQKRELPVASPVAQAQGKKPEAAATPPVAQAPVPSRKPIVKAVAPAAQAQAQAQQARAVAAAAQQEALLKKRRLQAPSPGPFNRQAPAAVGNQQVAKTPPPAPAQIAKTPPPAAAQRALTPRAAAAQIVKAPQPAAAQKIAKAPPVAKAPASGNQQIAKAPAAPAQKIAKAPAVPAQRLAQAPAAPAQRIAKAPPGGVVKKMIAKARPPAAAQEQRSFSKVMPVVGELALCLVGEYAGQRAKVVAVEDDEYTLAMGGGDFVTLSSAELKKG